MRNDLDTDGRGAGAFTRIPIDSYEVDREAVIAMLDRERRSLPSSLIGLSMLALGVAVLPNPAAMALLLALRLVSFLFTRNATARLDVRVRARQPIKTMQRIVFGAMAFAASRATSRVPGGWQNFVEMVVSLVDAQVKDSFHGNRALVTPLATLAGRAAAGSGLTLKQGITGGGGSLVVIGILAALVERARSGEGQVIDAAMVDGSAQLMSIFWGIDAIGGWGPRGTNLLDGGSHFYNVYATADGHCAIAAPSEHLWALLCEAMGRPEDELGRLSRALPLWFAETFHFSPHYGASAVIGLHASGGVKRPFLFGMEWTSENLSQLINTSADPLDYVITGALRHQAGDYELVLRVWEVKKFRERKQFTARWTPADAPQALTKLHEQIRAFMEWSPAPGGLPYAPPADARVWLDVLGASSGLFLSVKGLVPAELLPPTAPVFEALTPHTAGSPAASLAWLTLRDRVKALGREPLPAEALLHGDPLVARARELLPQ